MRSAAADELRNSAYNDNSVDFKDLIVPLKNEAKERRRSSLRQSKSGSLRSSRIFNAGLASQDDSFAKIMQHSFID